MGELFGYKNRLFLKIVFIPILISTYHQKKPQVTNTNVSENSVNTEV